MYPVDFTSLNAVDTRPMSLFNISPVEQSNEEVHIDNTRDPQKDQRQQARYKLIMV